MNKKYLLIAVTVLVVVVGLAWAYIESTKPMPGEQALQNSRNHIPEGSKTDYKFNPPTSGDHYPSWITKGVYDTPRADGNLVHSLEHGYIIFWYDCDKKLQASAVHSSQFTVNSYELTNNFFISRAYAHEASESASPSSSAPVSMEGGGEGSPSANLQDMPKSFSDGSCDSFKSQLKSIFSQFGQHKIVIVPRVRMEHPLILTAWGRMLSLDRIDKDQIKRFINFFRDRGPEATNEP